MFKRGEAPLFYIIPPPLSREGDKGGGLPDKKAKFVPLTMVMLYFAYESLGAGRIRAD